MGTWFGSMVGMGKWFIYCCILFFLGMGTAWCSQVAPFFFSCSSLFHKNTKLMKFFRYVTDIIWKCYSLGTRGTDLKKACMVTNLHNWLFCLFLIREEERVSFYEVKENFYTTTLHCLKSHIFLLLLQLDNCD